MKTGMHRGLLRTAAFVFLCVTLALAGSIVALRAAGCSAVP